MRDVLRHFPKFRKLERSDRRGLVSGLLCPTLRWKEIAQELPSRPVVPDEDPKDRLRLEACNLAN